MRNEKVRVTVQGLSRVMVFALSLGFFVGWLAAPEYLRKVRNLAARHLNLIPEPSAAALSTLLEANDPDSQAPSVESLPDPDIRVIVTKHQSATGSVVNGPTSAGS
jgi:hypothetical protein